jgi:aspartate carbamoyltransferase catalytic subunit
MSRSAVEALLDAASQHKAQMREGRAPKQTLAGKVIANVFFEDSTRTRSSFEIAAKALGAEVINWTTRGGSVSKGETLLDTVRNLDSLGLYALVMRHQSSGAPALVANHVHCAVINAGDGTHEHPSQGLLDAFTLLERFGKLDGRRVAIVGDILHSRVARSNIHCLGLLGAEVIVCAPPTLIPRGIEEMNVKVNSRVDEAIQGADAVMLLRIQLERQTDSLFPSTQEYARLFGLNAARAAKLKKDAVVMHPGPINRGVELSAEVADGDRSLILEQVTNGVAVRRAILEACA